MRRTRCGSKCLRSSSNTFGCCLGSSFAKLSTSLMTLASHSDASVFTVTGFSSYISGSHSHVGPFHQSSALVTSPPQLARSSGLSAVRTFLYLI